MADCCDNFILDEAQDDFGFSGGIGGTLPISMGGTGATSAEAAALNIIGPLPTVNALDEYDKVLIQRNSTAAIRKRRADAFAQDMWDMLYKDAEPIEDSTAPITSGAVYQALGGIFSPVKYATPGSLVHIEDGAYNQPIQGMRIAVNPVQSGTGDPSPDNVRPISGWDSAKLTRTGSNLVSPSDVVQGSLDGSGWNTASTTRLRTQFIAVEPNTVYSATINNGIQIYCVYEYRENQGYIKYTTINDSTVTFATSNTTAYVKLLFRFANNATITPQDVKGIQLCEGNTTSLLTVTVTWADSAGTIYGGYLTNNGDGTWALEVHWFGFRFDTAEKIAAMGSYADRRMQIRVNDIPYPRIKTVSTQLCSHAKYQSNAGLIHQDTIAEAQFQIYPSDNRIFFAIPGVDSLQGYKDFATAQMTAGTPLTFVSLVAESQYATYQLTGPEVLTLLGINNLWADTGDIEELAYRADIGLYLTAALNPIKEMLAYREDTMRATRAYTAGDFIVVGNTFYRVAVPIANGATLTPNTNVIKTTVGDQLKALS